MNAYQAFTTQFTAITSAIETTFSFGRTNWSALQNGLDLTLYLLGKLMKYTVGYVLAGIAGIVAAVFTSITNYFQPTPTEENIQTELEELPLMASNNHDANETMSPLKILKNEIKANAYQEKKSQLLGKIEQLKNRITQEIFRLDGICEPYDRIFNRRQALNSQLDNARKNLHAMKMIHCWHWQMAHVKNKKLPMKYIAIPNEEARNEAQRSCPKIEESLNQSDNQLPQEPQEYSQRNELKLIKSKLESQKHKCNHGRTQADLVSILTEYKNILRTAATYFLPGHFNINDYLPKSNYAMCAVSKVYRGYSFFSRISDDLEDLIFSFNISPAFTLFRQPSTPSVPTLALENVNAPPKLSMELIQEALAEDYASNNP